MKPSWKRCSSLKVSAKAWRRLSEGRARSRLCWNWEKIPWREEEKVQAWMFHLWTWRNRSQMRLNKPLMHKRCTSRPDKSVQAASSGCVWRCPDAKEPKHGQRDRLHQGNRLLVTLEKGTRGATDSQKTNAGGEFCLQPAHRPSPSLSQSHRGWPHH